MFCCWWFVVSWFICLVTWLDVFKWSLFLLHFESFDICLQRVQLWPLYNHPGMTVVLSGLIVTVTFLDLSVKHFLSVGILLISLSPLIFNWLLYFFFNRLTQLNLDFFAGDSFWVVFMCFLSFQDGFVFLPAAPKSLSHCFAVAHGNSGLLLSDWQLNLISRMWMGVIVSCFLGLLLQVWDLCSIGVLGWGQSSSAYSWLAVPGVECPLTNEW